MIPVVLASPYAGNRQRNLAYAHDAMLDSIRQGEAPLASHLLYPQVLDDNIEDERTLGISAEWAWLRIAHKLVVYLDLGISPGMKLAIDRADVLGIPIEERKLEGHWQGVAP